MERINELTAIVAREVASYADVDCWQCRVFFIADEKRQIYSVIGVPDYPREWSARADVIARVVGNKVIIEEDRTDRPLYEALMRAGIPREQMILVYAGEALPDTP